MNDTVGLTDLSGMGLTELQILPHYSRFLTKYPHFEQTVAEYESRCHCQLHKLNDGQGIFQTGTEIWAV